MEKIQADSFDKAESRIHVKQQTESKDKAKSIEKRTKKLFGQCFEVSKFEEGDTIPVGGNSIFSSDASIKIEVDFEKFQDFFSKINKYIEGQNLTEWREYLKSQNIDIDERLFIVLFSFTKAYEKKYPFAQEKDDAQRRDAQRKELLFSENKIKLSEIFNNNIGKCAEIAALAQAFLQQEKISSSYFSGDVLRNKEWEFSSKHSFIIVRHGGNFYIYDPANPTDTTSGEFPSIYVTEKKFDEEMAKKQKRFVAAKNILSKKEIFFGTNDGTDVEDKDIV